MFDQDWESTYTFSRTNHEKETASSQPALIKA